MRAAPPSGQWEQLQVEKLATKALSVAPPSGGTPQHSEPLLDHFLEHGVQRTCPAGNTTSGRHLEVESGLKGQDEREDVKNVGGHILDLRMKQS